MDFRTIHGKLRSRDTKEESAMAQDKQIQGGFFDADMRLQEISDQGDPLEKLDGYVDWEIFRPLLKRVFRREEKDASRGGRPPYDYVMMFKILVLQQLYDIADERTEFAIKDRLSFMRFLGLTLKDTVPDEKTIWLFRETLVQRGAVRKLFRLFNRCLEKNGLIVHATRGRRTRIFATARLQKAGRMILRSDVRRIRMPVGRKRTASGISATRTT
jgi:transposase